MTVVLEVVGTTAAGETVAAEAPGAGPGPAADRPDGTEVTAVPEDGPATAESGGSAAERTDRKSKAAAPLKGAAALCYSLGDSVPGGLS